MLAQFSTASVLLLAASTCLADRNLDRGAELFNDICTICHGEQAQGGEDFEAPKLAGQHDWYLTLQLKYFRTGIRGTHDDDENGQVMRPMVLTLTDENIEDVVSYIATLDPNFVEEDE